MKLKQTITQIDVAEYDVQIEMADGSYLCRNFYTEAMQFSGI